MTMTPQEHIDRAERFAEEALHVATSNHAASQNYSALARTHIELAKLKLNVPPRVILGIDDGILDCLAGSRISTPARKQDGKA